MKRILLLSLLSTQVRGDSVLTPMKFAVLPIAKVFTMCFMGFLMASKYVKILPANGRKLLNGLVFSLLLPCLIFSQLGRAVTLEKVREWWFIPFNVVLGGISGSLIGLVVASIIGPPYPYFKFTIVQIGIGNIGNIPLVLIAALCRDKSNPFGDSAKCTEDGTAYISFANGFQQWLNTLSVWNLMESAFAKHQVGAIILYTYVFQMLASPGDSFDNIEEGQVPRKTTSNNNAPEQGPLLTPLDPEPTHPVTSRREKIIGALFVLVEKLKLKQLIQPSIIASVLAMGIGCVPFLKRLILTDDAPLFFFTDSCIILGEAMIPCILLALGGNLVDGPGTGSSKLGLRTVAAIIFARLVLVPPTGLGIVTLADKLGFLPEGNKMFRFVLLLQHTMPTSVLAGAVANLRGCGKEAAAVLFWVHIFAIFSMAGWLTLYLSILF